MTRYATDYQNPTGYSQTLGELDATGTSVRESYVYGDQIIAQSGQSATSYFHADHLGSTRLLTNSTGTSVDDSVYNYEPYGLPTAGDGSLTSYAFTGQFRDADLGLQYHRARWLNCATAGWLSSDPVFDWPGNFGNGYLYGGASPLLFSDPGGNFNMVEMVGVAAIMAVLGAGAFGLLGGGAGAFLNNPGGGFTWGSRIGAALGLVVGGAIAAIGGTATLSAGALVLGIGFAAYFGGMALFKMAGIQTFSRDATAAQRARLRNALQNAITNDEIKQGAIAFLDGVSSIRITNDSTVPFDMAASLGTLYIHQNALSFGELDATGTSVRESYVYGDQIIAQSTQSATSYFHADHLGSTRLLTNSTGTSVDDSVYNYEPYGLPTAGDGSLTSYAFTGQYREADLGLQYHRANAYDVLPSPLKPLKRLWPRALPAPRDKSRG